MDKLSFSKQSRIEAIDSFKFSKNDCCNMNFLNGLYYFFDMNLITSDIEKPLRASRKLLRRYNINVELSDLGCRVKNHYTLDIENFIKSDVGYSKTPIFCCEKCKIAFLIGVFGMKAILTDPSKGYSLEFSSKDKDRLLYFDNILKTMNFELKYTLRKNLHIIYTKQSEVIEDILATVGAQSSCLEIMSGKVLKDIRNRTNRITNCDTANIYKISAAGEKYIDAINALIQDGRFDLLNEDLKNLAEIKLENPELSLEELGNECNPVLTKSSVNRRLQKIYKLSNIQGE